MEFKVPYVLAMREQDPKEFMALRRSGKLDEFLHQKSGEAHRLLKELLADKPKSEHGNYSTSDLRNAEEQVLATLIEFPPQERRSRF